MNPEPSELLTTITDFFRQHFQGELLDGEFANLRAFPAGGATPVNRFFTSFTEAAKFAVSIAPTHNTYFAVNPRKGQVGTKEAVSRVVCLHLDCDYKILPDEVAAYEALFDVMPSADTCTPACIVASGGGLQAYWKLDPLPATPENVHLAERAMAALCRGMGNVNPLFDVSRIMRVPGTRNMKYDKRPEVRVIFSADVTTPHSALQELIDTYPAPEREQTGHWGGAAHQNHDEPPSAERVREWLAWIDPTEPYDDWVKIVMAVHSAYPGQEGYDLVDEWSTSARENNGQYATLRSQPEKWAGFRRSGSDGSVSIGTLAFRAIENGWEAPRMTIVSRKPQSDASAEEPWEQPLSIDDRVLPPFPIDCLPRVLREYVSQLSKAKKTPPDLAAMLVLSALAASVAGKVQIMMDEEWREPLCLYTVTALSSANRKTGVFDAVRVPIEEWERREGERMRLEIAEAQSRRRRIENALTQAERSKKPEGQANAKSEATQLVRELAEVVVPVAPRILADDITPEKLSNLLAEQGGRVAILSDEGDTVDIIAGRYSDGQARLGVYLKGHTGGALRVDRSSRPSEFVRSATLTIGMAVQPDVIHALGERREFHGRGLLARFLYSLPQSLIGSRDPRPCPMTEQVRVGYHQLIEKLLNIQKAGFLDTDPRPHTIALDAGAQEVVLTHAIEVERQLPEGGRLNHMLEWGGKFHGQVMRIAGLLHCARHPDQPWGVRVSSVTVEHAWEIGQYLVAHAEAAFDLMGADPAMASARFLLRWIRREGRTEFTKSEAQQGNRGRFKRADDVNQPLRLLEQFGYIRVRPSTDGAKVGRKASPVYETHPCVCTENTENTENDLDSGILSISSILSTPLTA